MGMGRRGALPLDPAKGVTRKRASHDALRTLHLECGEGFQRPPAFGGGQGGKAPLPFYPQTQAFADG